MATVAAFSGCQPRTVYGEDGVFTWAQIKRKIAPPAYYRAQTGLIELENTGNLAGGTVFPQDVADEICDGAHELACQCISTARGSSTPPRPGIRGGDRRAGSIR